MIDKFPNRCPAAIPNSRGKRFHKWRTLSHTRYPPGDKRGDFHTKRVCDLCSKVDEFDGAYIGAFSL